MTRRQSFEGLQQTPGAGGHTAHGNAQSLGKDKGYGPPIPAATIVDDYRRIAAADPSRPVLPNLGQGVAWDARHGRGVRTNHPED